MFTTFDQHSMQRALALAGLAQKTGEVPVGAVITLDNQIIAEGYNQPSTQNDPTAHAEIVALRSAAKMLMNYRLVNTTLYTTLEPCCMCAGAIIHSRVQRVVYAAKDERGGAAGSVFSVLGSTMLNHVPCVVPGLLAEESSLLLKQFFQKRREKR